jgi:hypothetical protein
MTWDGFFVWKPYWYKRSPQETIKPVREDIAPAISRPVGEPEFIDFPPNNVPIEWANGEQLTWSDGTNVQWSENLVAESDIEPGN